MSGCFLPPRLLPSLHHVAKIPGLLCFLSTNGPQGSCSCLFSPAPPAVFPSSTSQPRTVVVQPARTHARPPGLSPKLTAVRDSVRSPHHAQSLSTSCLQGRASVLLHSESPGFAECTAPHTGAEPGAPARPRTSPHAPPPRGAVD
jgi:hypothetical protein